MPTKKVKRRSKTGPPSFVSNSSSDSGVGLDIYRPIKIFVYKNRDEYHLPTEIPVTRSHFKHWLSFLDYVGKRLDMLNAVHFLYTIKGRLLTGFNDLIADENYVAVSDKFVKAKYGSRVVDGGFKYAGVKDGVTHGGTLHSPEALDIYMQKMGFKPGALAPPPKSKPGERAKKRRVKKKKPGFAAPVSPPRSRSPTPESGGADDSESGVGTASSPRSGSVPTSAASRRSNSAATNRTASRQSEAAKSASRHTTAKSASRHTTAKSERPPTHASRKSVYSAKSQKSEGGEVDDTEEEGTDNDEPTTPPPKSVLA